MPVLYGVFLYMGVSSLKGMQVCARVMIFFMPAKYQPDYMFLRHVPIGRVHRFTFIQLFCLALLWTVKTIKAISIVFPLMVSGVYYANLLAFGTVQILPHCYCLMWEIFPHCYCLILEIFFTGMQL